MILSAILNKISTSKTFSKTNKIQACASAYLFQIAQETHLHMYDIHAKISQSIGLTLFQLSTCTLISLFCTLFGIH